MCLIHSSTPDQTPMPWENYAGNNLNPPPRPQRKRALTLDYPTADFQSSLFARVPAEVRKMIYEEVVGKRLLHIYRVRTQVEFHQPGKPVLCQKPCITTLPSCAGQICLGYHSSSPYGFQRGLHSIHLHERYDEGFHSIHLHEKRLRVQESVIKKLV